MLLRRFGGRSCDPFAHICRRIKPRKNAVIPPVSANTAFSPWRVRASLKTTKIRCDDASRRVGRRNRARGRFRPGPLLGRSWRGFGRSWRRPGRPSDALELSWRGLGRVRMRLGDAPERPRSPKTAQDRFWIDFSLIFERFFLDFRSSGLRRRHKIRISKRSRGILTARVGSCVVQSLRTARTSFEMTFEHYMFSLFRCINLRTHKLI